MKKLFLFMFILALTVSACSAGASGTGNTTIDTKVRAASSDKMEQVFIPDGSFQMGGVNDKAQPDEEPDRKVTVTGFWMDKTEVTNAMYAQCVAAGACEVPNETKSATRAEYYTNPEFADYPVVYVTWNDAGNYCKWAGRRLPTEAEWEYAARGTDLRNYPWGDADPSTDTANFEYKLKDTSKAGSLPAGASPFGLLDMAGNVWEWVSDYYSQNYYQTAPSENPTGPDKPGVNGLRMVIRGGSWVDGIGELRVSNRGFALAQDLTKDPLSNSYAGEANDHMGFRCAQNK